MLLQNKKKKNNNKKKNIYIRNASVTLLDTKSGIVIFVNSDLFLFALYGELA